MSTAFVNAHPYLFANLAGLSITALCWLAAGTQRRMMLLSGAVFAPFFPIAGLFSDGSYWTPAHVDLGPFSPIRLQGGPIGIEDLMFLLIAGARTWFFATVLARRQWIAAALPGLFLRRAVAITAAAFGALAILRMLGFGYTAASYIVPVGLGLVLLRMNGNRWMLALTGSIGSVALAAAELHAWFAIWPAYRSAWAPGAATTHALLGVPAGDLLWWAVVGAVHPLVMARCAEVIPADARPAGPLKSQLPSPPMRVNTSNARRGVEK